MITKEFFTKGDLKRLILPLIVERVLGATISVADTLMVARCGEAAVSGVSLVSSINLLMIQVFAALATGGAIVASQYLGGDDDENATVAAKQLLLVTGVLSAFIMMICIASKSFILNGLFGKAEPIVMQNANIYFFYSALSYPFLSIYNAAAALFRSMGNSRISMAASVFMNVLNISGNAILIFGYKMGVAGAAIASLVAHIAGAALLIFLLRSRHNRICIAELSDFGFRPKMVKNILQIGIPTGTETLIFEIGKLLVASLVTSFGTTAITANAVTNNMMTFSQITGSAINLAMITVIGQCIGGRDYQQARKYILRLTGLSYFSMLIVNIIMMLFMRQIVALFALSAATEQLAWKLSMICCLNGILFWPAAFTLPNGLRAANDVRYTMLSSVVSMWLWRVGLGYLLGSIIGLGAVGVWIAMGADWLFRMAMFSTRFFSGKWQNRQLI